MNSVLANTDVTGVSVDGSEGNEEHVIGDWREGDPCSVRTKNLAGSCPAVTGKAEPVNDELE